MEIIPSIVISIPITEMMMKSKSKKYYVLFKIGLKWHIALDLFLFESQNAPKKFYVFCGIETAFTLRTKMLCCY